MEFHSLGHVPPDALSLTIFVFFSMTKSVLGAEGPGLEFYLGGTQCSQPMICHAGLLRAEDLFAL